MANSLWERVDYFLCKSNAAVRQTCARRSAPVGEQRGPGRRLVTPARPVVPQGFTLPRDSPPWNRVTRPRIRVRGLRHRQDRRRRRRRPGPRRGAGIAAGGGGPDFHLTPVRLILLPLPGLDVLQLAHLGLQFLDLRLLAVELLQVALVRRGGRGHLLEVSPQPLLVVGDLLQLPLPPGQLALRRRQLRLERQGLLHGLLDRVAAGNRLEELPQRVLLAAAQRHLFDQILLLDHLQRGG